MVGDSVIVPGWSAPNDTSAGQRPGRNRRGADRIRRRIGIATRQQILIHRLRLGPGSLDRNVVDNRDVERALGGGGVLVCHLEGHAAQQRAVLAVVARLAVQ